MTVVWPVARAKHLFFETDLRGRNGPLLAATQDRGVVARSDLEYRVWNPTDATNYKYVQRGDFVISLRSFQGGIELVHDDGLVSPAYTTLRPRVDKTGFYRWLFKSSVFIGELASRSTGIRQGKSISSQQFLSMSLPMPPPSEQWLIADFLDRETQRIDALVDAKRRMSELLDEKVNRLVSHVVTRGLDTSAPIRESGDPNLGSIPGHWEVVRLKYVSETQAGLTLGSMHDPERSRTFPYLRVANVQNGYFDLVDVATVDVPPSVAHSHTLRPGDVLLLEGNGNPDNLGRGSIWTGEIEPCLHQNHVHAVRPHPDALLPEFLWRVTCSAFGRTSLTSGSAQVSIASLSLTRLRDFRFPLPPLGEQRNIVAHINSEGGRLERVIDTLKTQLALLAEYRQALITKAVTGQLDEATLKGEKPADEVVGV